MTTAAAAPPAPRRVPARARAAVPRQGGGPAIRRSARVRPYSLTGGRTRFGHVLLVETFVGAPAASPGAEPGPDAPGPGGLASRVLPEARAIVGLCRRLRSVAEVAALLKMPLGVVRVLIGDLADQGRIRVYGSGHTPGRPDRALLERVLSGLRRL
ncbi:DUF742 domain-containing protein [Streptomyces griseocarneus]|uniref:DUF742 domain-containing protein n=1 Tax=Streptomyces griseocarneus TaxID=51201 RepID=UPI00167DD1E3|nr:DUF742 domain-containing protein [Streptomyces griseocarneus]MBZ6473463.1 DUF742 domain-containing protein [Streptomyces griseocarneus]GHG56744.1 hypothetical protein GCM10018779_21270 [Streptomyces griseocarneus]